MKRKIELGMALLLIIGAIVASKKLSEYVEEVSSDHLSRTEPLIVIDPGHGGEDPGKVGINDVLEKEINLQISEKLKAAMEEKGFQIVMTREDDNVPEAKKEDLQERIDLINEIQPDLVICIHQNSFTDSEVCGAQVFYHGGSDISKEIAGMIQEELKLIDEKNDREIKGNENYFMLSNTNVPTVIVECGFLSNASDVEKVTTEEYQNQLAMAICDGVVKWVDK